ncbi:MAG: phosphoribosylglycinamide formyltransferase [Planctomycetota bacterium]
MTAAQSTGDPARLAVMVSGGGRTVRNLVERTRGGELLAEVVAVGASRRCGALDWAAAQGIPTVLGEVAVESLASTYTVDWIVLAGYTRLLPIAPGFEERVVNIHPALLPSFGGRGMYGARVHRAVIDAGCRLSGCTVHLCDEAYDRGPIVAQAVCAVEPEDTPDDLAARVFALERELYPAAIAALLDGFTVENGRVRLRQPVPPMGLASSPRASHAAKLAPGAS